MNDRPTQTNDSAAEPSTGSLDAIAAGLVAKAPEPSKPEQPRRPARAEAEPPPQSPDEPEDDADPDDTEGGGGDDGDEDDFLDSLTGQGRDDDAPDQDDFDPEDDRAVIRVKHNGKIEEVTLADLKRSWSGTKGIDARVQEAAEERNAAKAERELVSQTVAQTRALHDRLNAVYQHYNQAIFVPKVARPHPDMQRDDPIGYFSQMEAFREDQSRLAQEQAAMQHTLQQASAVFQQHRKDMLTQEAQALRTKLPGLKNPEQAAIFRKKISDIGQAHGFTAEEIAMADDHRLLTLAAEAAAYREMKARLSGKKAPTGEAAEVKRRPMPTRGDNRQKGETHRKAARARKAMAKARETGSVDDVALTLLT